MTGKRLIKIYKNNEKKISILLVSIFFFFSGTSFSLSENTFMPVDTQEEEIEITHDTNMLISDKLNVAKKLPKESNLSLPEDNIEGVDEFYFASEIVSEIETTDQSEKLEKILLSDTEFNKDDWNLILINKTHPIPIDYELNLGVIKDNLYADKRIIPELLEMLKAAQNDAVKLMICSPYRDTHKQEILFEKKIKDYIHKGKSYFEAYRLSAQTITIPGASEHEVGLALDIVCASHQSLDAAFGETQAGQWLREHSYEYGFILRYPKNKEGITGIEYEPWHFRYVGMAAAKVIYDENLTLEEFYQNLY